MTLAPFPSAASQAGSSPHEPLRQMLAVLEGERQSLASLDLERILTCADSKDRLCGLLAGFAGQRLDEEARGLVDAVRRLNDTNRKLRNLIAANVQTRLSALTGTGWRYGQAQASYARD